MTLSGVVIRDIFANLPAASEPGRIFFASDTGAVYRDNGSTWDEVGIGSVSELVNAQTGTTYTVVVGDLAKLLTLSNGSAVAVTLPEATSPFDAGWYADVRNLGVGTVTITPTTSTINGASTLVLLTGESARIISDGTDYQVTDLVRVAFAESAVTGLVSDLAGKVPTTRTISTTTPLTGGGDLSANRTLDISNFTGDSGSGGVKGAVPAPAAGDAAAGKFLKADGSFAVPAGTSSGTVSSVALTVPTFLSVSGSPVTTTGTLAVTLSGTALPVANGGTGTTTSTGSGNTVLSTSPTLVSPVLGTPTSVNLTNGTSLSLTTGVAGILPIANGGTGVSTNPPVMLPVSLVGMPGASATVFLFTAPVAISFAGNFAGSFGSVGVNPTATATYSVKKNGSSVGTIVISTGGVVTFTTTSGASQSLAAGDVLAVVGPTSQDATLANGAYTLYGTR